jgi:hypothetical protein
MKATIRELWDTGRQIISFDNSEFERPTDFRELKKCDNVIIGDKKMYNYREVMIDDGIYLCEIVKIKATYSNFIAIEII